MIAPEDLIRWFALGYWVVMLAIVLFIWLFVCLLIPKGHKWWVGILASIAVMAVFIVPIAKVDTQEKQENTVKQEKYLAAKAVFDARCKDAGYKIYRTVDNVEVVTLLNQWPDEKKYSDQMWKYAALPKMAKGELYILGFLQWRLWEAQDSKFEHYGNGFNTPIGVGYKRDNNINGYLYIDVFENNSYQRYKPANPYKIPGWLKEIPITQVKKPSRYTINFETPLNLEDRKIWIATTNVFIKDSQTEELLAEATWHTFHGPQGEIKYSGTGVWDRAETCPIGTNMQENPIQNFVFGVLKPKQINQGNNDGKLKN